jgi:hypothetical protein
MSQIINYGDTYMEMLSIFLRLLEKVIADSSWASEVDLSDVVLVGVKHSKGTAVDISLTGDGELKGIGAAGTGAREGAEIRRTPGCHRQDERPLRRRVVLRVAGPRVRAGTRAAAARLPEPG